MTVHLTVKQRVFLDLIAKGEGQGVYTLLGPNHPTVKWWRRQVDCEPYAEVAKDRALKLLNEN